MQFPIEHRQALWQQKIAEQKQSGKTIAKWCSQNNIRLSTFTAWKTKLKKRPPEKPFVDFIEIPQDFSTKAGIEIEIQGISIHLHKDFDAQTLYKCISVLRNLR